MKTRLCLLALFVLRCSPSLPDVAGDTPVGAEAHAELAAQSLETIRSIEDHRLSADARLTAYLHDGQTPVLTAALLAAGRIKDPAYLPAIHPLLQHADGSVRLQALFAVEMIASADSKAPLLARLDAGVSDAAELGALYDALAHLDAQEALARVEETLANDARPEVMRGAARAYQKLISTQDGKTPPRADTLHGLLRCASGGLTYCGAALLEASWLWKGLEPWLALADVLDAIDFNGNEAAANDLVLVLRRYSREHGEPALRRILDSATHTPNVRGRALYALQLSGWATPADITLALGSDSASLRVVALQAAGAVPALADASVVVALQRAVTDASVWVRAEALPVLAAASPDLAAPAIEAYLASEVPLLHGAAITALGSRDIPRLLTLALSPDLTVYPFAASAFSAMTVDQIGVDQARKIVGQLLALAEGDQTDTRVGAAATVAALHGLVEFVPALLNVYPYFTGGGCAESCANDARVAILHAFAGLKDPSTLPLIEGAFLDAERGVVSAAFDAFKAITGNPPALPVPLNSRVAADTPSSTLVAQALKSRVVLSLASGDIVIALLPEAPITAARLITFVEAGTYDGATFFRVVPAFVAQAGDPSNTGFGGPTAYVRDEVSMHGHLRGTVGMATSGRDTGGNEFFINVVDNVHLDDDYTVVGVVESGMDLVDQLQGGATILHASVR